MDSQEIRCESISISSSSNGNPKSAIFFHRFPEEDTDHTHCNHYIPTCSKHSSIVATVQCVSCVRNGLHLRQSYHCSNECYQSFHVFNHQDTNSLPPINMVSLFDERVELVIPPGREWINNVGPTNALVPFCDGIAFCFKVQSTRLCAKEVFATEPIIQRLKLSPRCISWLSDVSRRVSRVGKFSVLTYNILSDIYANAERYPWCPQWALAWEYRRKNLLHELISYNADILCLQEVQSDHFDNFFKPELAFFGYSGFYKRRTIAVYTGNGRDGYNMDGCATFFRNEIFQIVTTHEIEYDKFAFSLMGRLEWDEATRYRLFRGNVALAVILEVVGGAPEGSSALSKLCVVNTHLYAGRDSPDVKLFQVSELIKEIEDIIDPEMPLLVCGDINSSPGSDPYVLLTRHEVNPEVGEDPLKIYQHLRLHHSLNLASAYASAYSQLVNDMEGQRIHPETGEPLFTNLTRNHRNTLDYIFYSEDSLEVEGLLEVPKLENIGRSLPTPLWSSDHIALMASFKITRPFPWLKKSHFLKP